MGMHWFNPPEWTPGIELIPAQITDPQAVEQARSFLQAIGKHPIVVGSGPGFVANRIQLALFREALACVDARRTRGPGQLRDQNWRRLLQLHARGARAAVC